MALFRALPLALLTLAGLEPAASGQISAVEPFVGTRSEGFETQPVGVTDCVPRGIFQSAGQACTPAGIGVNVTTQWDFFCSLAPRSGNQLAGSLEGPLELTFDPPVGRFGGYFSTNGGPGTVTARFFSESGGELGLEDVVAPTNCTWRWSGWESSGRPIARILLRNSAHSGAFVQLDDLQIDPSNIGARYCSSEINSSGKAARIFAQGTTRVSANDLVLVGEGVPPGNTALFFYGAGEASLPFGNGTRCVSSGGVGLRRFPNLRADETGRVVMEVDYGAIPQSPTVIQPGSTWNFQTLFRDPSAGGQRFDLSDALRLSFVP